MKKFLITAAIAVALTGCSQIDTGNVGVESTMGQVSAETMQPGVYFTLFKRVTEVSTKELPIQLSDLRPQTADKITLADLDVDIYVQIDPSKAVAIMTRWPGDVSYEPTEDGARIGFNYVTRQAREAIFNAVDDFKSDVIHTKRVEIAAEVAKILQASLDTEAGKGWFFVRTVNIRNLVTDPALEASIKENAKRDYQIMTKQKEVELAKAEADRKRVEAQGNADAIRISAQAISVQGGDDYVRLKAIEKWDGKLPVTQAGGAVPFISLK